MNKNKLIIFDLDGTLYKLDGGSFLNSKLNKKILKNVVKYIQKKLKKNKKEAEIILKKIKKKYGENISIGLENDFKINRYDYFNFVWDIQPSQYIKKYPNLKKILAKLNKNYEFVLMSDAPCIWINNVLNELDINIFFKNKIFSGEGNKRKIFNNRFDELIKKYNFKPEQIVTIGDQEESDIIPAKKLGIKTIYINNKKSKIADVSIKNLENLESIFN